MDTGCKVVPRMLPVETVLSLGPGKVYLPWHSEPKQSQSAVKYVLRNRVCGTLGYEESSPEEA